MYSARALPGEEALSEGRKSQASPGPILATCLYDCEESLSRHYRVLFAVSEEPSFRYVHTPDAKTGKFSCSLWMNLRLLM